MRVRRGYLWALMVCIGLLGISLLHRLLAREETPEEVAKKCLHYLETRNVGALLRYITDEERDLLELDEEKLEVFLNRFFWKRLEGFTPSGEVKVETYFTGSVEASRGYVHPDGRRSHVATMAALTEKGPRVSELIARVFLAGLEASLTRDQRNADQLDLLAYLLPKVLPEMERLPVRGFVQFSDDGPFEARLRTWSDYTKEMLERWRERQKRRLKEMGWEGGGEN